VLAQVAEAVAQGLIDPRGKSDVELDREVGAYLRRVVRRVERSNSFPFAVDYRQGLLAHARRFKQAEELELACLLYATWCEHWANSTIATLAYRRGMNQTDVAALLRDCSLRAKLGPLVLALGGPRIPERHAIFVGRLAESRNSFVHYKWKFAEPETHDESAEQLRVLLLAVERTVRALMAWESRHLLVSSQKRLDTLMKGRRRPTRSIWTPPVKRKE
jgi:hypothetical protein